jgi:hypothetical protein
MGCSCPLCFLQAGDGDIAIGEAGTEPYHSQSEEQEEEKVRVDGRSPLFGSQLRGTQIWATSQASVLARTTPAASQCSTQDQAGTGLGA